MKSGANGEGGLGALSRNNRRPCLTPTGVDGVLSYVRESASHTSNELALAYLLHVCVKWQARRCSDRGCCRRRFYDPQFRWRRGSQEFRCCSILRRIGHRSIDKRRIRLRAASYHCIIRWEGNRRRGIKSWRLISRIEPALCNGSCDWILRLLNLISALTAT